MTWNGGIAVVALMGMAAGVPAVAAQGPPSPPAPSAPIKARQLCGLTAPDVAAFEPQVAKLPGITRKPDENGYRVYIDQANRHVWDFTTAAIPGNPAAACISVVPKDGGSEIAIDIICEGEKADCDVIAASFQDLAARVAGAR